MSKADELLNEWIEQAEDGFDRLCDFDNLHANTEEYLNRKDKLVVGSEWVCEISCYHCFGETEKNDKIVVSKSNFGVVNYVDLRGNTCEVYIGQFLACFNPKDQSKYDY